jgi:ankyrin repeat protein
MFKQWGVKRRTSRRCDSKTKAAFASTKTQIPVPTLGDSVPQGIIASLNLDDDCDELPAYIENDQACANTAIEDDERLYEWYSTLGEFNFYLEASLCLDQAEFGSHQNTILHYSAKRQNRQILEYVTRYISARRLDLDMPDRRGRTALEIAVVNDRYSNAALLLTANPYLAMLTSRGDGLLHLCVKVQASNAVLELLVQHGASIHATDADGKTPLELAVEKNSLRCVKMLLKMGVLIYASREQYDRLLHTAIKARASFRICSTIMSAERDTDCMGSVESSQHAASAIDTLLSALASCTTCASKHDAYTLLEHLLGRYSTIDPVRTIDNTRFQSFLRTLSVLPAEDSLAMKAAEQCLRSFLRKGFSPFESYDRLGPKSVPGACASLVAYSLLHASSSDAMGQIVEYCDAAGFGQELFYLLVSASKSSEWPRGAPPITIFLQALLNRGFHFDSNKNPLSLVLQDFPNDIPGEKIELVRSLMQSSNFRLWLRSSFLGHPLDRLTEVPMPLCWDLAEILLMNDHGLRLEATGDPEVDGCVFSTDAINHCRDYITPQYRHELGRFTSSTYKLQQCIVHVLSKHMIEDSRRLPAMVHLYQVQEAIRLRLEMCLPDVAIQLDNRLLLQLG